MQILTDLLRALRLRARALLRRGVAEDELGEELRFHIEMEAARLEREGLTPEEARRTALVLFGGVERFKEQTRDAWGTRIVEDTMQDLKYGLRMIVKNPVFSAVAIITLALGIGANTAIYTVVESVLLEPLPFEEPDELTLLWTRNDEQNQDKYMVSPMDFDDWRNMNRTFESMAAYWPTTGTITEVGGDPTGVRVVYTTENFFGLLGATTLAGRTFAADEGPESTPVVILGHGFWERRFGADPSIVGRTITLDGDPLEVIGIVRPEHTFPAEADLWINMTWAMQIQSRYARWMSAVGRLRDDTELTTARSDLVALAARIESENPDSNRGWTVTMAGLHDEMVGDTRTALIVLLSATGLILLIACANVANLLLSRSEVRAREIAVRVAFGADRPRLVRQLITESLVLAGAGAALGLLIAKLSVGALLSLAPVTLPRERSITLDGSILLVVVIVSLLTGVLFGLAPIWRLLRGDVHSTLRDGARSTTGLGGHRLQNAFVVGQLAMAMMLVVGAGLLVQSFANIRAIDTGFQPSGVLTFELDLATSVAEDDVDVINQYEQLRDRIAQLPGVRVVGDASQLPLGESIDYNQPFVFAERELPRELEPRAFFRPVSPGFFEAMGTPVVSGRSFESTDREGAPGVAIVNESFARRFFDGEDPVGERFGGMNYRWGPLGAIFLGDGAEIVGVVQDVKYDGIRSDAVPAIYVSGLQSSIRRRTITVRTAGAPEGVLPLVRQELTSLNPNLALRNLRTMDDVLSAAQSRDRFSTLLLTLFGVVALILASVGVYGVLAYAVEQRSGELGIRMALGAAAGDVRGMVLTDGARLVGVGLLLGVTGALALSGVLASQLFGVSPRDPLVYGSVIAILLVVGLLASFIPAWRATRVDPMIAMRAE